MTTITKEQLTFSYWQEHYKQLMEKHNYITFDYMEINQETINNFFDIPRKQLKRGMRFYPETKEQKARLIDYKANGTKNLFAISVAMKLSKIA